MLAYQPIGPADIPAEIPERAYRLMLRSRRLDEKMLNLLKQGRGYFHIGCAGHEALQTAVSLQSRPGHDWFSLYYRDLATYLGLGASDEDVLLHHLAKADDPNSGGRQMSEHFSCPEKQILPLSSSVGTQFLPPIGLAKALQWSEKDGYVYCSCGDGATSQGAFHEAMNWAARERLPILFLIQDNKYAISVPVAEQTAGGNASFFARGYEGMMRMRIDGTDFFEAYAAASAAIAHMRSGGGPVCMVADVPRLFPHSSSDNHAKYRSEEELAADRQIDPILRFEAQLLEAGILTTEKIALLRKEVAAGVDEAAQRCLAAADPDPSSALNHVLDDQPPSLEYADETSVTLQEQPLVLVDAVNQALREEMSRDERVIVYGEDVAGDKGGVFTATRGLTDAFGSRRCFNAQLAENSIIGSATGFAAAGYKPVVEIQFGDYIWPAMQSLRNQVASFRYRSNGRFAAPMVIRVPVGGYIHGGLCHSQNIEAIFAHMPGFMIAHPSTAADAKGLLKTAIRLNDPVLFLEHKALYRAASARTGTPDASYLLPFGKARCVREGSSMTIVTYGMMVHKSVAAARQLAKEGIEVEILDLRTIVPLDMASVLQSVRKTHRVLVVHEDHEFMGFGAEIASQISDTAFEYLDAPVRRLAGAFSPIPFADPLEQAVLPSEGGLTSAIRELLAY